MTGTGSSCATYAQNASLPVREVVVFDEAGKFVRSWGKEFRGVAHGLHIQKEWRDEFLYLSVNAAIMPRGQLDPMWQAAVECDVSMAMHTTTGRFKRHTLR